MTPSLPKPGASDRTVLWLACLLALAAGYYIAFYRLGAAIDEQRDLAGQVASIARANAEIVGARPKLEQTGRDLDEALRALDLHADHATTVARFIRESTRIATLQHTRLMQIEEHPQSLERRSPPAPGDASFEAIPLEVELSGSYRDLLGTIRAFAQAPLAMRIEIAALERESTGAVALDLPLTARLRVTVERLSDTPAGPSPGAIPTSEEAVHARPY